MFGIPAAGAEDNEIQWGGGGDQRDANTETDDGAAFCSNVIDLMK